MSRLPALEQEAGRQDQRIGPLTGWSRLLRVGVLGSAAMLLATGAHLLGGGRLPSVGLLVLTTFLVGLVAVTATARRLRLPVLLPLLAAEQSALHLLFVAADSGGGCSPAVATHTAHAAGAVAGCAPVDPMVMAVPGWSMWLAHLGAAAVTAWLLTRAEAALWALADRVHRLASAAPAARPSRRRPVPASSPFPAIIPVLLGRAAARAPPVAARLG